MDRFTHLKENPTSVFLLKESRSQIKDIIAIKSQEFGRITQQLWNANATPQITLEGHSAQRFASIEDGKV